MSHSSCMSVFVLVYQYLCLSIHLSLSLFIPRHSLNLSGILCVTLNVCLVVFVPLSVSLSLSLSASDALLSCGQADTAQLRQKISRLQATGGTCWLRQLNQLLHDNQVPGSDREHPHEPQVCLDGLTPLVFLQFVFSR